MRRNRFMGQNHLVRAALIGALTLSSVAAVAWSAPAQATPNTPKWQRQRPVSGRYLRSARTKLPPRHLVQPARLVPAPEPVTVHPRLAASGRWASLGASAIAVASASGRSIPVTVRLLSPTEGDRVGVHGLALRISAVPATYASSRLAVSVPVSQLSDVYGSDFANHARWVELQDCSLNRCGTTVLTRSIRLRVIANRGIPTSPASQLPKRSESSKQVALVTTVPLSTSPQIVTAAAATNASNGAGDASATSLKSASQWTASPQTGDFTWSYPLDAPPPAAGPQPDLSLAYDSNSINGETGSTNNQPSQVGEGFELAGGGYIERSYVSCSQAGVSGSGDLCWKNDNATLSLAGHSSSVVIDASGKWTLASDDHTKVEHLTSATLCSNGTYDNDCWRITTTDGTQYYFGRNKLPNWVSGKATTNSTWTVPVCGTATTACSGTTTTAAPFNTQAWRWNLDYVVDVHGNSEAFYYTTETNRYAEKSSTTASVAYVRGGYLAHIDYGMQSGYELSQQAPDQVVFTPAARCETGVAGEPSGACSTIPPSTSDAQYWPDVPFTDYYCSSTSCSGKISPTFWSTQRLAKVQTQYWTGSAYKPVDSWSLTPEYITPGDTTTASLELYSVTHTGQNGTAIALPATVFTYAIKPNRVAPPTGVVPLNKPRLNGITTETGAHITINYLDTDCSGTSLPSPQSNAKRCFPQYWAPPGGTLTLDWFRIYPVASVIADPKTGGTVDLPDQTFYDYSIGAPAYRLDTSPLTKDGQRTWSVFAGYNRVRVEHGDQGSPSTLQTTDYTYLRGMDGDIADTTGTRRAVSVTASDGTNVKDSLWWAGHTLETVTYNGLGGPQVADTITTPWAPATPTATGLSMTEKIGTSSTSFTYTPTARPTGDAASVTNEPLSTGGSRTTEIDYTHDSLGRVTNANDLGDTSTSADDRCTITSYVDNTTTWLFAASDEVDSYAGTCATAPSDPASQTISDLRTSYDSHAWGTAPSKGDATKVEQVTGYTGTTPLWTTETSTTYDAIGRPLDVIDGMSRKTSTRYTPAAPAAGTAPTADIGPVTQTILTDPKLFTTTNTLDPARGDVTASKDVNLHTTTTSYDALGRTTAVWLPDRPTTGTASTTYAYTVTAGHPLAVATTTLTPTGGTKTGYALYDGLGRLRQTQNPAESATYNATPGSGGASVTETLYDFAGQAVNSYGPYLISAAPSGTLWTPSAYSNIATSTETTLDGAGRPTASITYAFGAEQWRTTTDYKGTDRIDTTSPNGAAATSVYSDGLGRTTRLLQYHGGTIGDPTDASTYDETSYAYYPTGQMQTMTAGGEQWSWTYDVLGRVRTQTNPNSGTTTTAYDADSEVQSTTDADGTTLWYSYDGDGRKTAVNQDSASGALLASWHYDAITGAKGLLDTSTSYVGSSAGAPGDPYAESITGYDADGRTLGASVTVPAGALGTGSAAYTYATSMTYNADGTTATQVDPQAGNLPGETLHYTYTSLGRLYSLIGAKQYLTGVGYDPATSMVVGQARDNGTNRLNDSYTYTPGTLRLSNVQTTTSATSNNLVANVQYGYDNAGDITEISNTPNGTPTDTQCFQYDYAQRLKEAWTPGTTDCGSVPNTTSLGGAAPYWESFGYDTLGNRTSVIDHATDAGGTDEQDTYNYPLGPTPTQPNAPTSISHATALAGSDNYTTTATDSYAYDADGQATTDAAQTLGWTPQGRLASVQLSDGTIQTRVYDADGNILVQSDPVNGTTAYLGDTQLHVAANSTTLTGQRIYNANGKAVAARTSAGIFWLDTDPQGTSELTENFATGAVQTRYFDPFGSPRGGTSLWPEDRGFLNRPHDSFSDFTDLGARVYDAEAGRFLSVDPVLNLNDPQSLNGYGYSNENPATRSDPTGLCPVDICGGGEPVGGTNGRQVTKKYNMSPVYSDYDKKYDGGLTETQSDARPAVPHGTCISISCVSLPGVVKAVVADRSTQSPKSPPQVAVQDDPSSSEPAMGSYAYYGCKNGDATCRTTAACTDGAAGSPVDCASAYNPPGCDNSNSCPFGPNSGLCGGYEGSSPYCASYGESPAHYQAKWQHLRGQQDHSSISDRLLEVGQSVTEIVSDAGGCLAGMGYMTETGPIGMAVGCGTGAVLSQVGTMNEQFP